MRRRSLVLRLLLLTAAAAILPSLIISIVQRSIGLSALQASIQEQQTELARRIAEEIGGEVEQAQGLLRVVAHSSFLSAASRVDQYEALRNLLQEAPQLQEVMFVNDNGEEVLKVSQRAAHPVLLKRTDDIRHAFIGRPFFSGNRSPSILMGEPIRTFANPARGGAIFAKLSFTSLSRLLQQATVGPHGEAFIVDSHGVLLAHPDERKVFAHSDLARGPVVQEWQSQTDRPTALRQFRREDGQMMVALAYPIPLLDSAVVVQQPKSDVYGPMRRMQQGFVLCALLSVVVFVLLALVVAWRILYPLGQLREAAEQIGQGRLDLKLDIHTHDELEELGATFESMARSLRDLERLRRDLVNMVVHDLKIPLSTILPSLDSLITGDLGKLTPDQQHFVQMARRSGQEMLMLIQNLLDVSRMEEGLMRLHKEAFIPRDWAENVVTTFHPLAEAAGKRVELMVSKELPVMEGDIPLLGRVLGNLLSNALRHTPSGSGEVTLSIYADGTQLAVQVGDNGEGIAEADQPHIFERFVQGSSNSPAVRFGTGLGLTFCKMVVEAHGGRITVFSQPHEGSLFTFYLPLPLQVTPVSFTPSVAETARTETTAPVSV